MNKVDLHTHATLRKTGIAVVSIETISHFNISRINMHFVCLVKTLNFTIAKGSQSLSSDLYTEIEDDVQVTYVQCLSQPPSCRLSFCYLLRSHFRLLDCSQVFPCLTFNSSKTNLTVQLNIVIKIKTIFVDRTTDMQPCCP